MNPTDNNSKIPPFELQNNSNNERKAHALDPAVAMFLEDAKRAIRAKTQAGPSAEERTFIATQGSLPQTRDLPSLLSASISPLALFQTKRALNSEFKDE